MGLLTSSFEKGELFRIGLEKTKVVSYLHEHESVLERGFGGGVHCRRGFCYVLRLAECGGDGQRIGSYCDALAPRAFRRRHGVPLFLSARPNVYGGTRGGGGGHFFPKCDRLFLASFLYSSHSLV